MNKIKFSVIIATLGGYELKDTINSLNKSSIKPKEILVCLPGTDGLVENVPSDPNVQVFHTGVRGQVAQRAIGFQNVKYDYVLQLDDDIKLNHYCLEELLKNLLKLPAKSTVAPALYLESSGNYAYTRRFGKQAEFLNRIQNGKEGFQNGKISKAGTNFGIILVNNKKPQKVGWQPGACILHHKKNLVDYNYYKYTGKAYAEDLFHSHLLRKKKINLYVVPSAKAYFEWVSIVLRGWENIKDIFYLYRAYWRFAKFSSASKVRLFFYILFSELFTWFSLRKQFIMSIIFRIKRVIKLVLLKWKFWAYRQL